MTTHNMLAKMRHDNIPLAGFHSMSTSPCGDIKLPAILLQQWSIASKRHTCQLQPARCLVPQQKLCSSQVYRMPSGPHRKRPRLNPPAATKRRKDRECPRMHPARHRDHTVHLFCAAVRRSTQKPLGKALPAQNLAAALTSFNCHCCPSTSHHSSSPWATQLKLSA